MHLLYKVHFWSRMEMIFYSKNITKSDAIFLHGKVCQGSKNIQELFQIFVGKKNGGCFGAQVSELNFREKNEYFSFMNGNYANIFILLNTHDVYVIMATWFCLFLRQTHLSDPEYVIENKLDPIDSPMN